MTPFRKIICIAALCWTLLWAGMWLRSYRSIETFWIGRWKGGTSRLVCVQGAARLVWTPGILSDKYSSPTWVSYRPATWGLIKEIAPDDLTWSRWHLRRGTFPNRPKSFSIDGGTILFNWWPGVWWLDLDASHWWEIPIWMPAAAGLVIFALGVPGATLPARRHRRGLCPACGYDLRASPTLCPECGTAKTPAKSFARTSLKIALPAALLFCAVAFLPARQPLIGGARGVWAASNVSFEVQNPGYWRNIALRLSPGKSIKIGLGDSGYSGAGSSGPSTWEADGDLIIVHHEQWAELYCAWMDRGKLILCPAEDWRLDTFRKAPTIALEPRDNWPKDEVPDFEPK